MYTMRTGLRSIRLHQQFSTKLNFILLSFITVKNLLCVYRKTNHSVEQNAAQNARQKSFSQNIVDALYALFVSWTISSFHCCLQIVCNWLDTSGNHYLDESSKEIFFWVIEIRQTLHTYPHFFQMSSKVLKYFQHLWCDPTKGTQSRKTGFPKCSWNW